MAENRDWQRNREMWVRVLERTTGQDVAAWNRRIARQNPRDENSLRRWLTEQGVRGYAQSLLVMERFGYPDFVLASADELVAGQYGDRLHLRPVYDAVVEAALALGNVAIQARKTYVSLVTQRRTFARIQPTTRDRVDLGLRIEGQSPVGRLRASRIHETMKLQIGLSSLEDIDDEVLGWLERAHQDNS